MNTLYQSVTESLSRFSKECNVFIAVSGGLDSVALLHAVAELSNQGVINKPTVLHVNHNLHPDSSNWASFVHGLSISHQLAYKCINVHCANKSEGEARDKRYEAFFSVISEGDVLLLAHHFDDQYETFIFRAFRGTSLRGLIGMKQISKHNEQYIVRPFLNIKKTQLQKYLEENSLAWVHDPSNNQEQYSRNIIRKAMTYIPSKDSFQLTNQHLLRQQTLLSECCEEKLNGIKIAPHIIDIDMLKLMSSDWQTELFHLWLNQQGIQIPYLQELDVFKSIVAAKQDRYPSAKVGDRVLLRYRNTITVLYLPECAPEIKTQLPLIDVGPVGSIVNPCKHELNIVLLQENKGQYKKILQQAGIPNWLRRYIPVIECCGDTFLATDNKMYDYSLSWNVPEQWAYWFNHSF